MSAIKENQKDARFMKNKFHRELFPEHVEKLLQEDFEIRDDKRVIEETYPTEEDRSKPDKVPSGKKIAFRNLVDVHEFESEPADNDTTLSEHLVEQVDTKPTTETISRKAEKKDDSLVDEFDLTTVEISYSTNKRELDSLRVYQSTTDLTKSPENQKKNFNVNNVIKILPFNSYKKTRTINK